MVATPIGNLEDITLRALRVLREVALVAAEDTRHTARLLRHYDIPTPVVSYHEHNERSRSRELVARLAAGDSVALVSDAGTPLVSDPGFVLVREAVAAGVPVVCVPGPSALAAALSVAALPVDGFTFAGFPPSRAAERRRWLAGLSGVPRTVVLYEAPHRVRATLETILAVLGDRWTVLARELTKVHEATKRGWLSDLLSEGVEERGEYVILLSDQIAGANVQRCEGAKVPTDADIADSFGRMTEIGGLSPRDAVAKIADESGLTRQSVYRVLKKAGVLG